MVAILGILGIVLFLLLTVSGRVNQGGVMLGIIIFIGAIVIKGFPEGLWIGGIINLFIDFGSLLSLPFLLKNK